MCVLCVALMIRSYYVCDIVILKLFDVLYSQYGKLFAMYMQCQHTRARRACQAYRNSYWNDDDDKWMMLLYVQCTRIYLYISQRNAWNINCRASLSVFCAIHGVVAHAHTTQSQWNDVILFRISRTENWKAFAVDGDLRCARFLDCLVGSYKMTWMNSLWYTKETNNNNNKETKKRQEEEHLKWMML